MSEKEEREDMQVDLDYEPTLSADGEEWVPPDLPEITSKNLARVCGAKVPWAFVMVEIQNTMTPKKGPSVHTIESRDFSHNKRLSL